VPARPARRRRNFAQRTGYRQAKAYNFSGYGLVTKGTWYLQVQQIDSSGTNGQRVSPIEKIHIS
jgi:hypothetical protein